MPANIHSVALETRGPSRKDAVKALGLCLRGRFREAQSTLRGEQWLVSYDANGNKIFGISGGANMAVFVGNNTPAEKPATSQPLPVFPIEPIITQKAVMVRRSPVTFKRK